MQRSPSNLDTAFAQIKEQWDRLDILFITGFTKFRPLLDVDEAFISETMDPNFKGALFTVQKAVPLSKENSSIVFNTSINNQMGMLNSGIYAASKAGLRSRFCVLAAELIERGIRVNTVSPGLIKTPLYTKLGRAIMSRLRSWDAATYVEHPAPHRQTLMAFRHSCYGVGILSVER